MALEDKDLVASVLAGLRAKTTSDHAEPSIDASSEDDKDLEETQSKPNRKKAGRRPKKPEPKFPVEPRIIQTIKKPKTFVDHSYRDFSCVPPEPNEAQLANIDDMTFAQKVHHILSQEDYGRWIKWNAHGRSFRVLVPKCLEKAQVLKKYFGHNRYSSFLRQLNNHGFKHITQGPDRNSYYHQVS